MRGSGRPPGGAVVSGLAARGSPGLGLTPGKERVKTGTFYAHPDLLYSVWAPTVPPKSPENLWANPGQQMPGERAPSSRPG